jgi:hypothetical protein
MNVPTTWSTSPSANTPSKPSEVRRAKQISGAASASNRSRFMAHRVLASPPHEILSPICRLYDAVQKIYRREPVPEAGEGLDTGGKCYVKTLLQHVTGVEDCHFCRIA